MVCILLFHPRNCYLLNFTCLDFFPSCKLVANMLSPATGFTSNLLLALSINVYFTFVIVTVIYAEFIDVKAFPRDVVFSNVVYICSS